MLYLNFIIPCQMFLTFTDIMEVHIVTAFLYFYIKTYKESLKANFPRASRFSGSTL